MRRNIHFLIETEKCLFASKEKILFPHVFMWDDMWDVLQYKLGSFLAFLQLLEQQAGLQVPERNTRDVEVSF